MTARVFLDRFDFLKGYVTGKTVLDLGCVEYSRKNISKPGWLHARIAMEAKDTVGVDMADTGWPMHGIHRQDVGRRFDLHRKFDVIVAGEIMEHVGDQGVFLGNVKRHLKPGGKLLITTPNAASMGAFLRRIFKLHGGLSQARGHVLMHDERTLGMLLEGHGFMLERLEYWQACGYGKRRLLVPLLRLWPDMATNMVAVARLGKKGGSVAA